MNAYSFKIENGLVVDGKVNSADFGAASLTEMLGGVWVENNELIPIGIGWTWNETDGFRPPAPPEPPVE